MREPCQCNIDTVLFVLVPPNAENAILHVPMGADVIMYYVIEMHAAGGEI